LLLEFLEVLDAAQAGSVSIDAPDEAGVSSPLEALGAKHRPPEPDVTALPLGKAGSYRFLTVTVRKGRPNSRKSAVPNWQTNGTRKTRLTYYRLVTYILTPPNIRYIEKLNWTHLSDGPYT